MVHRVGLKSEYHEAEVIRILQNNDNLKLGLLGKDGDSLTSENILMLSPFIRSVLNSLQSLSDTVLILPDLVLAGAPHPGRPNARASWRG